MKQTPRIHIVLRRSKRLGFFILAAAALTAALLWTLPWPWWAILVMNALILVWAYFAWQKQIIRNGRCKPLTAFTLRVDGMLLLEKLGGDKDHRDENEPRMMKRAALQSGYYVGNRFVTLVWCEEDSGAKGKALLLPDMMDEDEWRKLRILLRYVRIGDAAASAPDVS